MSEHLDEKAKEKAWVMRTTIGFSIAVFAVIAAAEYATLYYSNVRNQYLAIVCSGLVVIGAISWLKGGSDRRNRALVKRQAEAGPNAVAEANPFQFLARGEYLGIALVLATALTYSILYYQQRPKPVHIVARAKEPPKPEPKPVEKTPVAFPPMKLNGLVMRQTRPAAIINSHTYFVGDYIGDAEVTSITLAGVTLEEAGEKMLLELGQ
jgi:hypothetical protein